MMAYGDAGGSMLQSRSPPQTRAKNRSNSPSPSSRLGRLFLPLAGTRLCPLSAAIFADQLNSVPSIHMRCRMTASLRATATLALRSPLRLASLAPKPSRLTILGRAAAEPRLLQIDNFVASRRRIWRCDRSNRPLRTHGVYWLARRKHLRFSIAQTVSDRQSLP